HDQGHRRRHGRRAAHLAERAQGDERRGAPGQRRERGQERRRVLAVPFVIAAIWFLTGTLGETFLDWTA
ncbi:MAG TPA: hypothetical protein VFT09_05930, partial [Ilumatobacteraceae bacterium]|nr:hypothetical protein [Ilumatobacteraceae bacterium]